MNRKQILAVLLFVFAPALSLAGEGIDAQITSVVITADRRPQVTFAIKDAKGKPLAVGDLDPDSLQFTVAAIKVGSGGQSEYQNYILSSVRGKEYTYNNKTHTPTIAETAQPDIDRGGTLKQLRPGMLSYLFRNSLPANYDRNATHVVGGGLTRENGKYVANPLFEFVPSGAKVKVQRSVVATASCNSCHDPLQAHGGARREVGTCVLCHTPQLIDPESGESLDFKVFVHKIHRGKLLASVREGKPFFTVARKSTPQRLFDDSLSASADDRRDSQGPEKL